MLPRGSCPLFKLLEHKGAHASTSDNARITESAAIQLVSAWRLVARSASEDQCSGNTTSIKILAVLWHTMPLGNMTTTGALGDMVVTCHGCGASSFDDEGRCEYCGSRFFYRVEPQPSSHRSEGSFSGASKQSEVKRNAIKNAQKELSFFEEQYRETGHPSLIIKMARAKEKLIQAQSITCEIKK